MQNRCPVAIPFVGFLIVRGQARPAQGNDAAAGSLSRPARRVRRSTQRHEDLLTAFATAESCALEARARTVWWLERTATKRPGPSVAVELPLVVILWGREDRIADVRNAARFQHDIGGSELVVIDDATQCTRRSRTP
jgi:hypothetical protein